MLQEDLKAEMLIVEEKKAGTFALIESIGQEKGIVDEAVESSRADEEDAARLQASPYGPFACRQLQSVVHSAFKVFGRNYATSDAMMEVNSAAWTAKAQLGAAHEL